MTRMPKIENRVVQHNAVHICDCQLNDKRPKFIVRHSTVLKMSVVQKRNSLVIVVQKQNTIIQNFCGHPIV
jgi:hypothetical protein